MKALKAIYWLSTILLCAIFLYSAGMYLTNTETVKGIFVALNYPEYLVIPSAIAKILAVLIVVSRCSDWLTEWTYAGLFFDLILAFFAHYYAGDNNTMLPLFGMVVLLLSYFFGKVVRP